MGGLAALYFAALLIAGGILLVVAIVGGLILRSAARAVDRAGRDAPAPSTTERAISALLLVIAFALALAPAVITIAATATYGDGVLPGETGAVASVAFALGVLTISAARLFRHGAARRAAAGLLVLVLVVPASIQVWIAAQTITFASQSVSSRQQAEQRATRYADLIDGPSPGEIVSAVGNVGTWRAVGGSLHPFLRGDEWLGSQVPIADLSGRTVRFAIVAQCWVEGDPGELVVSVHDFEVGVIAGARFGRCDGTVQVFVTDPVTLEDWPVGRLDQARTGDRLLVGISTTVVGAGQSNVPGEYAIRTVTFVSAEPTSPAGDLEAAVARAAGSFDIR